MVYNNEINHLVGNVNIVLNGFISDNFNINMGVFNRGVLLLYLWNLKP